ncbi:hypothetical protein GCM10014715_83760 [Streptomyces spiralis]|uniref:Uncharacterized protein n=1 Tax=Streptomyces spiralis TaxID=66376 RepID=A0A919E3G2_9ACTN|nr:hypothetical protein GCM10014715_83760 [Streptomyces spiralis]
MAALSPAGQRDSTTAGAHHDAAGMQLGEDVLTALEEAAAEEEKARSKGAMSKDKTGDPPTVTAPGKSAAADGVDTDSG